MSEGHVPATARGRVTTYIVAFVIGALYGAVATVGHRNEWRIGDLAIPWGLVAALAGVTGLLLGIRLVAGGRGAAAAAAAGVIGVTALLTFAGWGGSVLVAGDLVGTVWSIAPAFIAVLVVAWPKLPTTRRTGA
ncbi:hypothetical protein J7E29_03125 [Streptomyces sp. ISL-90]|nr:hypothetical protein [Streptomyces sp. ISL-90]